MPVLLSLYSTRPASPSNGGTSVRHCQRPRHADAAVYEHALIAPASGMLSDWIGPRPVMVPGMLLQGGGPCGRRSASSSPGRTPRSCRACARRISGPIGRAEGSAPGPRSLTAGTPRRLVRIARAGCAGAATGSELVGPQDDGECALYTV